jgi:hypothetical protein
VSITIRVRGVEIELDEDQDITRILASIRREERRDAPGDRASRTPRSQGKRTRTEGPPSLGARLRARSHWCVVAALAQTSEWLSAETLAQRSGIKREQLGSMMRWLKYDAAAYDVALEALVERAREGTRAPRYRATEALRALFRDHGSA